MVTVLLNKQLLSMLRDSDLKSQCLSLAAILRARLPNARK